MPQRTLSVNCFVVVATLLSGLLGCAANDEPVALDKFGDALPKGAFARLGTIRWRVGGHARGLTFSPDDQFLATGSVDDTVRIWEAAGKEVKRFSGHKPWVSAVAYSPNGTVVASAGADKVIRLRDAKSGKEIRTLAGQDPVASLAFSPKGDILAAGGGDKNADVRLWNTKTGEELHRLAHGDQVQSVAFASEGKTILSASTDGLIREWNVESGMEGRRFDGKFANARWIRVAASSDGRWIAAGGGAREPTIIVWNAETAKLHCRLEGHTHFFLTALAFSPDGKMLASGSLNYDVGTSSIFLWDPTTGKEIRRLNQPKHGISSLAFSHDGTILAAGANSTIHRWQVEDGKLLDSPDAHQEMVMSIVFSADGNNVATGGMDGTVRIWDAKTGAHLRKLAEHSSGVPFLAFVADGKRLVHIGKDLRICDSGTGQELHKMELPENTYAEAISPDGKTMLSTNSIGTAQLWDVESRKVQMNLGDKRARRAIFSHDGKTVAIATDTTIQVWDRAAKKITKSITVHNDVDRGIRHFALSPDGKKLAVVAELASSASLWDISTGKEDRRFDAGEHEIFSLAFSANGKLLALGSWDKTIRVFETTTAKQTAHLKGNQGHINALAFSPDGRTLASGSTDSTVLLWSIRAD